MRASDGATGGLVGLDTARTWRRRFRIPLERRAVACPSPGPSAR